MSFGEVLIQNRMKLMFLKLINRVEKDTPQKYVLKYSKNNSPNTLKNIYSLFSPQPIYFFHQFLPNYENNYLHHFADSFREEYLINFHVYHNCLLIKSP